MYAAGIYTRLAVSRLNLYLSQDKNLAQGRYTENYGDSQVEMRFNRAPDGRINKEIILNVPPPVEPEAIPEELQQPYFYIPGCVAKYSNLTNAITGGILESNVISLFPHSSLVDFDIEGYSFPYAPELDYTESFQQLILPGTDYSGGITTAGHMPVSGSFSVACFLKVMESLDYDYMDGSTIGYMRPRVISQQSDAWWHDCPGSFCPIIGYHDPCDTDERHTIISKPTGGTVSFYNYKSLWGCDGEPVLNADALFPLPYGFIYGFNFVGLFLYNGTQLMAGKVSDWEAQYSNTPLTTDALMTEQWYHAVLSYDADTYYMRLLLSTKDPENNEVSWTSYIAYQPDSSMVDIGGSNWVDGAFKSKIGQYGYTFVPESGNYTFEWRDSFGAVQEYTLTTYNQIMNANLRVAHPRFYHRALNTAEMGFLRDEAWFSRYIVEDQTLNDFITRGIPVLWAGEQ
jgi:hypothetical protein